MQNKFDVIITTYNRENSLKILVGNILKQTVLPENIIIVDSSPIENIEIECVEKVLYIKSSHGNQPYQRYLGLRASQEEILIFMDDDMRILDKDAFKIIISKYSENIIGVQPNFTNANEFLQESVPKSKINIGSERLFKFIKTCTGYYTPPAGKLSYCGIRGKKPKDSAYVEYFNGGIFSIKKEFIFTEKFNFYLFTMFENKLGMGEDTILGFEASRYGKIMYIDNSMFLHDDQKDSTYSVDISSYGKRVAYSRLYLSFEYSRLQNKSKFIPFIHYNWYMLWRVLGLTINYVVLSKDKKRKDMLVAYIYGWKKALNSTFTLCKQSTNTYWLNECSNDKNI